jgi:hypothetical protein
MASKSFIIFETHQTTTTARTTSGHFTIAAATAEPLSLEGLVGSVVVLGGGLVVH